MLRCTSTAPFEAALADSNRHPCAPGPNCLGMNTYLCLRFSTATQSLRLPRRTLKPYFLRSQHRQPFRDTPATAMAMSSAVPPPQKVCVFGSGSFGTAMGTIAARNGYSVVRARAFHQALPARSSSASRQPTGLASSCTYALPSARYHNSIGICKHTCLILYPAPLM